MSTDAVINTFLMHHDPVTESPIDDDFINDLYTLQMFDQVFDLLYTHLTTAIRLDEEELQAALRAGRRDRVFNSTSLRYAWEMIKKNANHAWNELLLVFRTDFAPSVEVPQQLLRTKVPIWDETLRDLVEVEAQMDRLTVDDAWQGDGAASYREALPAKKHAVAQTIALAANARRGVEAVALIQATIDQALYGTLLNYYFRMYDRVNRVVKSSSGGGGRVLAGRNQLNRPQQLLSRTRYTTERFKELTKYIREELCDPNKSDWVAASQGISKTLGAATRDTRAGRVSQVAEYDSNASVNQREIADDSV